MEELKVTKTYESGNVELRTNDETLSVTIKWDGCVDIHKSYNGMTVDEDVGADYIHICDLDEHIAYLQQIKEIRDKMLKKS